MASQYVKYNSMQDKKNKTDLMPKKQLLPKSLHI